MNKKNRENEEHDMYIREIRFYKNKRKKKKRLFFITHDAKSTGIPFILFFLGYYWEVFNGVVVVVVLVVVVIQIIHYSI